MKTSTITPPRSEAETPTDNQSVSTPTSEYSIRWKDVFDLSSFR